jgi:hypothetical protein
MLDGSDITKHLYCLQKYVKSLYTALNPQTLLMIRKPYPPKLSALFAAVGMLFCFSHLAKAQFSGIAPVKLFGDNPILRTNNNAGAWLDINNDRRSDFVFAIDKPQINNVNQQGQIIKIALNLPSILIGDSVITAGVTSAQVVYFRQSFVNIDNLPDLVIGASGITSRFVYTGTSFEAYDSTNTISPYYFDADGDGDEDTYIMQRDFATNSNTVQLMLNLGLGVASNFSTQVQGSSRLLNSANGFTVLRMDGTGTPEIVVHTAYAPDTNTWWITRDTNIVYASTAGSYTATFGIKGRIAGFGNNSGGLNYCQVKDLNGDGRPELFSGEGFAFQRANGRYVYAQKRYRRQLLGKGDASVPECYFYAFSPTIGNQHPLSWYIKARVDSAGVEGSQANYPASDSILIKNRGGYTFEDIDGDGQRDLLETITISNQAPAINWRKCLSGMRFARQSTLMEFMHPVIYASYNAGGMVAHSKQSVFFVPRSNTNALAQPTRIFGPVPHPNLPGSPNLIYTTRYSDADGDGRNEVIVYGDSGIVIVSTTPGVAPILFRQFPCLADMYLPALVDVNNDNIPDVVEQTDTWFRTWLGTTPGQLAAPFNTVPTQTIRPTGLQVQRGIYSNSLSGLNGDRGTYQNFVQDFDGDGNLDIVVYDQLASLGVSPILFYSKGNGNGTFQNAYIPILKNQLNSLEYFIQDFNSDGKTDVIVKTCCNPVSWKLYYQDGGGRYDTLNSVSFSNEGYELLECADFNEDGTKDIVFIGLRSGTNEYTLNVYLSQSNTTYDSNPTVYVLPNGTERDYYRSISTILPFLTGSTLPDYISSLSLGTITPVNTDWAHNITNSTAVITGTVYNDGMTNDCLRDSTETGLENWTVIGEPGGYFAKTDANGKYSMVVDTLVRTVTIRPSPNAVVLSVCPPQFIPSLRGSERREVNIGASPIDCYNLKATMIGGSFALMRTSMVTVHVENVGTRPSPPPIVNIQLPGRTKYDTNFRIYQGAYYTVDTLRGNRIVIRANDSLQAGQSVNLYYYSIQDQDAALLNQSLCMRVQVLPRANCYGPTSPNNRVASNLEITSACVGTVPRFKVYNAGGIMADSVNYDLFSQNGQIVVGKIFLRPLDSITIFPVNLGLPAGLPSHLVVRQEVSTGTVYSAASVENCNSRNGITPGFLGGLPGNEPAATSVVCWPVQAAYDPNEKYVTPSGTGPNNNVPYDGLMKYQISFENEGSDTAYTIVVLDTLDSDLDIATFRMAGSTHSLTHTVRHIEDGRAVIRFVFRNIKLTYTAQDSVLSQGSLSFYIRAKEGLPMGTVIENTGHIYFDINPAVVTNTVRTTLSEDAVVEPTAMRGSLSTSASLALNPNPASSQLAVKVTGQPLGYEPKVRIMDANGRIVSTLTLTDSRLTINHLTPGIYMLEATLANGSVLRSRFAKE